MEPESPIQSSPPSGAVFLSYAAQDAEGVRRIREALGAAGIEVWFDRRAGVIQPRIPAGVCGRCRPRC
jgi:TIR domain